MIEFTETERDLMLRALVFVLEECPSEQPNFRESVVALYDKIYKIEL